VTLRSPLAFSGEQSAASAVVALRRHFGRRDASGAAIEARCLVEAACGLDRAGLIAQGERPLGEQSAGRLSSLAARRLAGEPLARILGSREFWGLPFGLSAATLEPRPETETLVEAVLRHCEERGALDRPWRFLDLGTGSGCVAIALLKELPQATALCVDRSVAALETARDNARRLGVAERARFIASDWASAVSASFDVLASNPPYVASRDIPELAPEVRDHDPVLALDGGADGLDCHRSIVTDASRLLRTGGRIFLEIGAGQDARLLALLAQEGLSDMRTYPDLAGIVRVVSAGKRDDTA
jgi:release factor glutamine methyltransferase